MEAAARSSSQVRRAKRPRTTAAQIDFLPAVGIEAAAGSASRPPRKRRRTSQIGTPSRRRAKTLRPHHPLWPWDWGRSPRGLDDSKQPLPSPVDNSNWTDWANIDDGPAGLIDDSKQPLARPNRGAQRACTDLPCPVDNNNWRDWANIDDGPAGLIAERVLACDVADYVRFRAVCRPWRHCSSEPRTHSGLDRRFHPWRWTMLREELAVPHHRCFLNTSSGECINVDIPELNDNLLLTVTREGLLILLHKTQWATVRLLNPLTRHLTELPPLTNLLPPEYHHRLSSLNSQFGLEFTASGSGIANDDSTFVLCLKSPRMIGMAKPGDDHWTSLTYRCGVTATPLMFAGRFYYVSPDGLMVLETGGVDQSPRLELAAEMDMHLCSLSDRVHLFNNCGELMLVHSCCRRLASQGDELVRCYDVYRVDLNTGTLSPVKSLGGGAGRAVFMGMHCSLSVSLDVFPSSSISANTIYWRSAISQNARTYHLADGSSEDTGRYKGRRPHTLVDCLSLAVTL